MKPNKKPELLTLKKATIPKPQPEQIEDILTSEPIIDRLPPQDTKTPATEYLQSDTPLQDYPIAQSVGNSGWQPSDIWRDLRVDSFYD